MTAMAAMSYREQQDAAAEREADVMQRGMRGSHRPGTGRSRVTAAENATHETSRVPPGIQDRIDNAIESSRKKREGT